jgi:hypothetical protein
MLFSAATLLTIATAAFALPNEKRSVDPYVPIKQINSCCSILTPNRASASLALFGVLPASLQAVAVTNPAAAASEISSEFATGTPTWFTALPTDVQTYFLTQAGSAVPTSTGSLIPATVGATLKANGTSVLGPYSNSTAIKTSAAETSAGATSAAGTSAGATAASSSSTGGAAMPTMIGGGIAAAIGMLALAL